MTVFFAIFGGREASLLLELLLEIGAVAEAAVVGNGLVVPFGMHLDNVLGLIDAQFVHSGCVGKVMLPQPDR